MPYKEPFHFKNFSLQHQQSAHKIGTDGILLGAWASHPGPRKILDVGAGCGLIALMLAQRYPRARFLGIDTHLPSVAEAHDNLHYSPYAERGTFLEANFLDWKSERKFDLIVSNPPFHPEKVVSAEVSRDQARRSSALPLEQLIALSAEKLTPDGRLALILPASQAKLAITKAAHHHLFPERIAVVQSRATSAPIRTLLQFNYFGQSCQVEKIILYQNDQTRHKDFQKLTGSFYLA